jgi:nucleotide-binding universal stress UspA family protein
MSDPTTTGASRTLTFGDDGTEASDPTWGWISAHRWTGWSLRVVNAQPAPPGPPHPDDELLRPWDPPRPRDGAAAGFAEVAHLTCRCDPRVALLGSTDLLVVGPRGRGLMKALHVGSTAEWLLHHPPSPLVVARVPGAVRRVLVATDGSAHARRAADAFATLPWAAETEVLALAVADGRTAVDRGPVDGVIEALSPAGVTPSVLTASGSPTHAILGAIEQHGVDLVVLGTKGLTGLRRLRLGSTAGAVARTAPCSTLLASDEPPATGAP